MGAVVRLALAGAALLLVVSHSFTDKFSHGVKLEYKLTPRELPQVCKHLYNVGRHSEWAECMGVGYK